MFEGSSSSPVGEKLVFLLFLLFVTSWFRSRGCGPESVWDEHNIRLSKSIIIIIVGLMSNPRLYTLLENKQVRKSAQSD